MPEDLPRYVSPSGTVCTGLTRMGATGEALRRVVHCGMVALLLSVVPAVNLTAQTADSAPQTYPWWHGMSPPAFWWLIPLAFLGLMAFMCFRMMRKGGGGAPWERFGSTAGPVKAAGADESAVQILDRRFAKGEIGRQEYEEKKALITGSGGDPR